MVVVGIALYSVTTAFSFDELLFSTLHTVGLRLLYLVAGV